jgi:malonyl CoA-acyl carrier protein transacylase
VPAHTALFAGQGGAFAHDLSASLRGGSAGVRRTLQGLHIALLEELDCMPTHLLQELYAQGEATLLGAVGDDGGDDAEGDGAAPPPGQGANGHGGGHGGGADRAGGTSRGAGNGVGGTGSASGTKSGAEQADMPSAATTMAHIHAAQLGRYIAAEQQPLGASTGLSVHLRSALGHSQGMAAALAVSAAGVSPEALSCFSRRAPCAASLFRAACALSQRADSTRSSAVHRCSFIPARAACPSSRCCGSARARKTWRCR